MPKETFFRLRDDKQERILRAAIHEFVENGFDRAKISVIAQKAGVATGSIYQYFDDKKELFVYSAEWGLKVFMEKLDARANVVDMDVFSYFQDTLSKTQVIDEERELVVFMQAIQRESGLIEPSMKAMYNTGNIYIKKLIQNSKSKGLVRTDIDDELLMEYFIAVTERFEMRWMKRYVDFRKELTEEQNRLIHNEMKQMLDLLKKGMGC